MADRKGFGWLKQTGPIRQVKLRGLHNVDWLFVFSCAAHNLMRLPKLIALARQSKPVQQCASSSTGGRNPPSPSLQTRVNTRKMRISKRTRPRHRRKHQATPTDHANFNKFLEAPF